MLIARVYARYFVALTVLAVIAFAPLLAFALRIAAPADAAQASTLLRLTYVLAAVGWLPLTMLVGGATIALEGGSQRHVMWAGLKQIVRAIVPCLFAAAAILIGGVALVVPGLALMVLLSLTGASQTRGLPAPLTESVTVVRANLRSVLTIIAMTCCIAVALIFATQWIVTPIPLPKKPAPAQLIAFVQFLRIAIAVLVIASPVPAIALAAVHREHS